MTGGMCHLPCGQAVNRNPEYKSDAGKGFFSFKKGKDVILSDGALYRFTVGT